MDEREYVTFTEARQMLGVVSKDTLRRIIKRAGMTVYNNPRDAREKLLLRSEVEAYMRPRPIEKERDDAQ
jgi:hypothetical protein